MTSSAAHIDSNKTEAQRRALYMLAVAAFPIALSGLITMLVFLSGAVAMDDGVSHRGANAEFSYPVPGSIVAERFESRGTVKSIPAGHSVYLVEEANGKFWPKRRLGDMAGAFSHEHYAKDGAGYKYTIVLLSVPDAGKQQIESWFDVGRETGRYPGIADIDGMTKLAKVRVIR